MTGLNKDEGVAFPICAVCDKPVNKVEYMYDINYDAKIFRVFCHGQMEQQILSSYIVMDAKEITFGKAFDYPKLKEKNAA